MHLTISKGCPNCKTVLTWVTDKPKSIENTVTVCGHCAAMLNLDHDYQLNELTLKDFEDLEQDVRENLNEQVKKVVNKHL